MTKRGQKSEFFHCCRDRAGCVVETGRWVGQAHDNRVCPCDDVSIQDEEHVFLFCRKTLFLRRHFDLNFNSILSLFQSVDQLNLIDFIYDVSKVFE